MGIELYEHNQIAYESALSMLAEAGRAAIVHPTGTGKSFIGFKLCENFPDKTVCWLSPSEYIFRTQVENLKAAADGYAPENIRFSTYARLAMMDTEELEALEPDYIVLDEFHRCGAQVWGQGVQRLLARYPDVPVLGLSATSIRYLDNRRDMSDELFGGNVASEMTLGEAIVRGILKPPRYVTAVYSYAKDLERYEQRVKKLQRKTQREKAQQYLEALRRALEKADGLDEVFDRNLTDRTGKYIVFCAGKDHMDAMAGKAPEWFHKVDAHPHVYSVYSEDPYASRSFEDFKSDDDREHLRLLFCIDALNEGIHVGDISGVILLRPTVSPIIYKQQIGRALSAGGERQPVVFDVVNNIAGLYSISSVEEEMREIVRYYRFLGEERNIVNEHFRVTDELQDVRTLFDGLESSLRASWDFMYAEAREYYREYGDLLPSQSYVTKSGARLGQWLVTQRTNYRAGSGISDARIRMLEAIGMDWRTMRERQWEEGYGLAKDFYDRHGSLEATRGTSPKLAYWLARQRQKYREGQLEDREYRLLSEIGMKWEFEDAWEEKYAAAKAYFEAHGDLEIPAAYVTGDGLALGAWCRGVRGQYLAGGLPAERAQRMEAIGMKWQPVLERGWMRYYEAAQKYRREHGDLNVHAAYVTPDGVRLGAWISGQRYSRKKQRLTEQQIQMLDGIGMSWQRPANRWDAAYTYAKDYADRYGSLNPAANYVTEDGFPLGRWVASQRRKYHSGKLREGQKENLDDLGLVWNPADCAWKEGYAHALEYFQEHGNLEAPGGYTCRDGYKLGTWLSNQRTRGRDGRMTESQRKLLEEAGMVWTFQGDRWQAGYERARAYQSRYGNCNVPQKYVCADGYALGEWVTAQRKAYREGKQPEERIRRLEALGFSWNIYADRWNRGYSYARSYRTHGGAVPIPQTYVTRDGYPLGEWMRSQERRYRHGALESEKIRRLAEIGVVFEARTAESAGMDMAAR